MGLGRVIGLFIGRDGRIPEGINVPVTGNGRTGSGATPTVKFTGKVKGKHGTTQKPGRHK